MPRKPRTEEQKLAEKLQARERAKRKAEQQAQGEPVPTPTPEPITPHLADDMPPVPVPGPYPSTPPPGVDTWVPTPRSNLTFEEAQVVAFHLLQEKCEIIWNARAFRQGIDSIEKLLVCLMRGAEIGIPPVQAATAIYLSRDGMPGMSAELMVACVMRSGIGTIEYGDLDDMTAAVRGIRYGTRGRQDTMMHVVITLDDLRATGWVPEPGFLPRDTLRARAISRLCRAFFPDVLGGVSYSPDEVREIDANAQRREPVGHKSLDTAAIKQAEEDDHRGAVEAAKQVATSKSEAKRLAAQQKPAPPKVKPTPSPAPEPASPPAATPTAAIPERAMIRVYQVPGPNGEPVPLHTAGITLDQLRQVGELAQADPTLIPRAKEWMTERGIASSKHLYEAEGEALLTYMRSQQAFPKLSLDRAISELDEEIERQGLSDIREAVYQYLAVKGDDPHDHLRAADDLRKQGDDPAALRLALTQMQALG